MLSKHPRVKNLANLAFVVTAPVWFLAQMRTHGQLPQKEAVILTSLIIALAVWFGVHFIACIAERIIKAGRPPAS